MSGQSKVDKLKREFGISIRRKRHKENMSQEELAHKANIHRTYISSIELGKVDIGLAVAYKITTALNTSLSKVLKEIEKTI